ncbi:hypothetical protein SAMN04490355_104061 [Pelosinus propionicus DSM 13327]|uniref:Uncharacterized protein n=1 Tax=Pelosinus propionicus DSM 13327 TaxID=1123291 RepID=A0A1I4N2C7_9FIRM|nr:hypothetical protein SAMN04490355_104061 [Pelosinus propionicus DSM 13327]
MAKDLIVITAIIVLIVYILDEFSKSDTDD